MVRTLVVGLGWAQRSSLTRAWSGSEDGATPCNTLPHALQAHKVYCYTILVKQKNLHGLLPHDFEEVLCSLEVIAGLEPEAMLVANPGFGLRRRRSAS